MGSRRQVDLTGNTRNTHPPHALLFMYPLQGHIIPAFNLAKKLAFKGVIVTVVCTEACYARITKAHKGREPFSNAATRLGLQIRCVQVSDGLPLDFDRLSNFYESRESLLNKMEPHVEKLVHDLQAKGPPVSCIIADTTFPWTHRMAKKIGVLHVSFWTQPAMVFAIYYNWDLLVQNGQFPSTNNEEEVINYIPGAPALKLTDLPSHFQELDGSTILHKLLYEAFQTVRDADSVICNTVHELEISTIEEVQLQSGIPVLSVGPLISLPFFEDGAERCEDEVKASMWAESDCRSWLDSHAPNSVIYISFGSYAHLSKAQIEEFAMGLLESRQTFLWVLRPDIVACDGHDILPEGFLDVCKEQGMVVLWSSQVDILSHSSVGGFLTHCGWNSVMESIWLGVPMLAFPLVADQYTNCRLIVDKWEVAMRLGESSRCLNNMRLELVYREEIATAFKKFMHTDGEERRKMSSRLESVKEVMKKARRKGGSSDSNLDRFIQTLKATDHSRFETRNGSKPCI